MTIIPTPGRIVWYTPSENDARFSSVPFIGLHGTGPFAAIVASVLPSANADGSNTVNLAVFDSEGTHHTRQNVKLLAPGAVTPTDGSYYAQWMPYQINQVAEKNAQVPQAVAATDSPVPVGTLSGTADVQKSTP